ncbi:metallophosphoesterase family protein [Nocardia sp. NPDC059228]|uniref:metallophosphoesterase family protein n=1 Tax=Nocardia sp. NPDC059228 TaxID=3346777 RepID=UPI003684A404
MTFPAEYVRAHLDSPTEPRGHGFTEQNLIEGTTYYSYDAVPGVRMIVLDSTHPAGHVTGSIGARQWDWLVDQLIAAHSSYRGEDGAIVRTGNRDRAMIIASHHGLGMLTNSTPDPDGETRYLAAYLEALLHRFGNVVLWIAGHEHRNEVTLRRRPPDPQEDPAGGFWHVLTSGLCEWPCQTRLLELVLPQQDSSHLIIRSTMIDHSAPERPGQALELLNLASLHRELSFNEPTRVGGPHSAGTPADRTVDLIVPVSPALLASLRGAMARSERPSTGDRDGNAVVLGPN